MSYTIGYSSIDFNTTISENDFNRILKNSSTTIVDNIYSDDKGNDEDFIDLVDNFIDDDVEDVSEVVEYFKQFITFENGNINISTNTEDTYLQVFEYLCKEFSKYMTKDYSIGVDVCEDSKEGVSRDLFILNKEGMFGVYEN